MKNRLRSSNRGSVSWWTSTSTWSAYGDEWVHIHCFILLSSVHEVQVRQIMWYYIIMLTAFEYCGRDTLWRRNEISVYIRGSHKRVSNAPFAPAVIGMVLLTKSCLFFCFVSDSWEKWMQQWRFCTQFTAQKRGRWKWKWTWQQFSPCS